MAVEMRFDPDQDGASEAVIRAIAEIEEKSVTEVQPVLYETIDPEALDSLVGHTGADLQISFTHGVYQVEIAAGGILSVATIVTGE